MSENPKLGDSPDQSGDLPTVVKRWEWRAGESFGLGGIHPGKRFDSILAALREHFPNTTIPPDARQIDVKTRAKDGSWWRIVGEEEDGTWRGIALPDSPPAGPANAVRHIDTVERIVGVGSYHRDLDGTDLWASDNLMRLLGIGEMKLDPRIVPFREFVHEDDLPRVKAYIEKLRDDPSETISVEFRGFIDDEDRHFCASFVPDVDDDGTPYGTGVLRDVTEQRQAEAAQALATAELEALIEAIPVGVYSIDENQNHRYANAYLLDLLEAESMEDLDWIERIHPDDLPNSARIFEECVRSGEPRTDKFRIIRTDGEIRYLESRMALFDTPAGKGLVSYTLDRTREMLRERELSENRIQLDWSQRISQTGSWLVDATTQRRKWSQGMFDIFEVDPATAGTGELAIIEHVPESHRDEVDRIANRIVAEGEGWDLSFPIVTPKGNQKWIRSVGEPIRRDGKIVQLRGVCQDISSTRDLEEKVRRNEKMQALGELAGGVAHDFNNMLAAILGNAELLAEELEGEQLLDCLEIVEISQRCGDLTNQLLAFSRRQPLERQPVAVREIVESATNMLRYAVERHIDQYIRFPDFDVHVVGEKSRLENAVLNVTLNAIQAMPEGGQLEIDVDLTELRPEEWDQSEFSVTECPAVAITIRDTGDGIEDELLDRVVDPFFSTKRSKGGNGLGLATTYGTVRNHGGAMRINSKVGEGTTVEIILPRTIEVTHEKTDQEWSSSDFDGMRALVADDEASVRRMLCRYLESVGFEVDAVGGHQDAVAAISAIERGERYDLGVFDLSMPDGSGVDTQMAFHSRWPGQPVIIASGYDVGTALDDENDYTVLQKPFRLKSLVRILAEAFGDSDQ